MRTAAATRAGRDGDARKVGHRADGEGVNAEAKAADDGTKAAMTTESRSGALNKEREG